MKTFSTLILSACIAAYAEAIELSLSEHLKEAIGKAILSEQNTGNLS
jgi:hypothetical protein